MTTIRERLWLPDGRLVHGRGLVELRDERGRKTLELPFENFIAQPQLEYARHVVKHFAYERDWGGDVDSLSIDRGVESARPPGGSTITVGAIPGYSSGSPVYRRLHLDPMQTLFCSDDSSAEDAANERLPKGEVIAFAQKLTTNAHAKGGLYNVAESELDDDHVKYVFDWATDRGNGTFRSVGWGAFSDVDGCVGYADISPETCWNLLRTTAAGFFVPTDGYNLNSDAHLAERPDGTVAYIVGYDTSVLPAGRYKVFVFNKTTKKVTSLLFNAPANIGNYTFGVDNTPEFYLSDQLTTNIRVYDASGTLQRSIDTGETNLGCAIVGTSLFVMSGARSYVMEFPKAGGAKIAEWDVDAAYPGWTPQGIWRDKDGYLIVTDGSGTAIRFTTAGVLLDKQTLPTGNAPQSGLQDPVLGGHHYITAAASTNTITGNRLDCSLATRTKLGADVTKDSTQTMKITYEFTY